MWTPKLDQNNICFSGFQSNFQCPKSISIHSFDWLILIISAGIDFPSANKDKLFLRATVCVCVFKEEKFSRIQLQENIW